MSGSKDYFDTIGAGWDEMQERFFSDRVRERAFEVAGIEPGRSAVDQSRPMLDGLRAKYPDASGLDCRVGDAENVPVDDGSVDYCFANMCLHHVERPARAILEMARILKPGGRLVITDLDAARLGAEVAVEPGQRLLDSLGPWHGVTAVVDDPLLVLVGRAK